MILNIYAIFDVKVGAFLPQFSMRSDNEAIRACADIMFDGQHNLARFAGDYSLYQLASYDNCTGTYENNKRLVFTLIEIRALYDLKAQNPLFDRVADTQSVTNLKEV